MRTGKLNVHLEGGGHVYMYILISMYVCIQNFTDRPYLHTVVYTNIYIHPVFLRALRKGLARLALAEVFRGFHVAALFSNYRQRAELR